MKKKFLLSFVLMCISIFALGMLTVSAETTGTYGDLTYEISNGEVTITDCNTYVKEVTIPTEIDGNPVTAIGNKAFYCQYKLRSITIPNGITSIGGKAFFGCSRLTRVKIPGSVTTIGSYAFGNCSELYSVYISDLNAYLNCDYQVDSSNPMQFAKELYLNGEILKGVLEIPSSVTQIPNYAFRNCSGLTSVIIGDSVTTIGDYAFAGCTMETFVFSKNLADIGGSAFSDSTIDKVDIQDIVTYLNCNYQGYGSTPMQFAKELYLNGEILEGVLEIPSSVTQIPNYAFRNCSGLTSVIIGDSVTTIGDYAFAGCTMETFVFQKKITDISNSAFLGSTIDKIDIQDIATYLNCDYHENKIPFTSSKKYLNGKPIKKITIESEDDVSKIPGYAFSNTTLESIEINCDISICSDSFNSCNELKSVIINGNVGAIPPYAFKECLKLENVTIKQYSSIGKEAFFRCRLKNFVIPDGCVSIGESAFYDVYFSTLTIPESLKSVSAGIFRNGTYYSGGGVNTLYIDNIESYLNIEPIEYQLNGTRLKNIPFHASKIYVNGELLVNLAIPSTVQSIPDSAFQSCQCLESITISEGVTKIGNHTFSGTSNLVSVLIPESVKEIGQAAFSNCTALSKVEISSIESWCSIKFGNTYMGGNPLDYANNLYLNDSLITDLVIPIGMKEIGKSSFKNCNKIKTVTIPNTILEINEYAFYNCDNVSEVYYNGTEEDWDAIYIADGNNSLKNARVQSIYYITLIDDDGNTSSITCQPNTKIKLSDIEKKYMHKLTLYTDEAMTKEFDATTAITNNMTLYVKLGEEITVIYGDIDDDGEITMNDAIYLFNAAMFPDQYSIPSGQKTDYNGDGNFDMNDAIYLFNHAMFPEQYPI